MTDECFICGISSEKKRLFDSINEKGIAKICKECAHDEKIPLLEKTEKIYEKPILKEVPVNTKSSVYERLSKITGFKKIEKEEKNEIKEKQERELRTIVNENFKQKELSKQTRFHPFLIDNFHWIIMRARRLNHLTKEQFAKKISESETAIISIEQGNLPKDFHRLIYKIEKYLKVKITKKEFEQEVEKKIRELGFDPIIAQNLTISDLRERKLRKEDALNKENKSENDFF